MTSGRATTHMHVGILSTGVTHRERETHIRIPPPRPAHMHCYPREIKLHSFTARRRTPFLDDQKPSRRMRAMAAREAAAREPSVLMVRRSQPVDPARARLFRASARFPTRSRLLSLCAHFPCATMSARAGCGAQEWSSDTMTL